MQEIQGNLWDYHKETQNYIVITTNGYVKNNGCCVMGRGIAKECMQRFPSMPLKLGSKIQKYGNHVFVFPEYRLISLPVKHKWDQIADLKLIKQSLNELWVYAIRNLLNFNIYMPRPGCGNGHLNWEEVKPLIDQLGLDNLTIIDFASPKAPTDPPAQTSQEPQNHPPE